MTRSNGKNQPLPTASLFNERAEESCFRSPFTLNLPDLSEPSKLGPVLFDSPHSGEDYPSYVLADTNYAAMRTLEDVKVNHLLAKLPQQGFATQLAHFPRVLIDLNRNEVGAFDLVHENSTRRLRDDSVQSLDCNQSLDLDELLMRLTKLYRPYHASLTNTLKEMQNNYGTAILLDMHSFSKEVIPQQDIESIGERHTPDIILGTHGDRTANRHLTSLIADCFRSNGYSVVTNQLFIGAHIVMHHGNPNKNIHAVQIEMAENYYDRRENRFIPREAERMQETLRKVGEATQDWALQQPSYSAALNKTGSVLPERGLTLRS